MMERDKDYLLGTARRATRLRASDRRATRGSVFVEVLIVCIVLSLFFAGGMGLHRAYTAKLLAMHDTRALAWAKAYAREGCAPPLDAGNLFRNVLDAADDPIGIGLPASGLGTRPTAVSGTFGHVREEAEYAFEGSELLGWGEGTARHDMQLACAEAVQSQHGTIFDVALYGVHTLFPGFLREQF